MTRRPFDEHAVFGSFDFQSWKSRAKLAREAVEQAFSSGATWEFDSSLWRELKPYLLDYFFGKCAYCEIKITSGFWGDVEHYRPKRKVDEEPAHPGYYWLAYEPSNLMPSCQRCNQGKGKMNRFPVVPGTRAMNESGVIREEPLLLMPYTDHPSQHLEFDFNFALGQPTGYVKGLTLKGRTSVGVYGLNRAELVDERRRAQRETLTAWEAVLAAYKTMVCAGISEVDQPRMPDLLLSDLLKGAETYAAARVSALEFWMKWSRTKEQQFLDVLGTSTDSSN